ncbi:MAG: DUF4190 domain-containing protein [Verrucomicrobia bacterium]|jgi:hypothetical protein|nr:DUF4190 domain-containing protein [Verrucomicrobiota bacterium]
MSDLAFSCPHCGKQLSASEDMEGTAISCPSCQNPLTVPIRIVIEPDPPPSAEMSCSYCRMPLNHNEAINTCPSCRTPHHEECWAENGGCSVFGCPEAPEEEDTISISPAATSTRSSHGRSSAASPPFQKKNAPGATSSLVWGILGFLICGLILGIVAISNANKAKKLIQEQPDVYTGDGLATAGLVIGIIDLVAWGLILLGKIAGAAS